ncbi:SidA/IucD/PvdA family monooxygenase [Methylopila turkensis]|uniref:SidA/IucD/PvdA family monooxygenase n=1 Tax=Methylopila turkensis TaxID=1437816 RepID=UPI0022F33661|nr:SidA/IucD/PvdA family monooxygenase [Methylopila turkensis]
MANVQRLAVIGAGAKAAAICAKAACIRDETRLPIEVTVFERHRPGANWTGDHGYSDGAQRLCTPAERDIGFPYDPASYGDAVSRAMYSRYSWLAYKASSGSYGDWVDRGRPRPGHNEFANYLDACIRASGYPIVQGEVVGLTPTGSKWSIGVNEPSARRVHGEFDGVVATGPGPAAPKFDVAPGAVVYDSVDFWNRLEDARTACLGQPDEPVVIVGSGGTAAATASWLVRADVPNEIIILGGQPALFARTDSFFENRAFRDPDIWATLSEAHRLAFSDRLTRGAVWANVVDDLSRSDRVFYRPGTVSAARVADSGGTYVEYATSATPTAVSQEAVIVVDASGFDLAWFADLLPPALCRQVRDDIGAMRSGMDASTALPLAGAPKLHAPMLSQLISPSFASLIALGDMSDAILLPYIEALMA